MSMQAPNNGLRNNAAHSSQPCRGTPSDGSAVPGRDNAHPGKIAPPNSDRLAGHRPAGNAGFSGQPASPFGTTPPAPTGVEPFTQAGFPKSFQPDGPWLRDSAPKAPKGR